MHSLPKLTASLAIIIASFLLMPTVFAQFGIEQAGSNAGLGAFKFTATTLLERVILASLALVGLVSIAAIVYGAFTYITSIGDEQRVSRAKKVILYAIIGLIIAFAAGAIVSFVFTTLT